MEETKTLEETPKEKGKSPWKRNWQTWGDRSFTAKDLGLGRHGIPLDFLLADPCVESGQGRWEERA